MAQKNLNTIQIVLVARHKNPLTKMILMAHICKNVTIQIKTHVLNSSHVAGVENAFLLIFNIFEQPQKASKL